jgi:hypothetical protein
VEANHPLNIDVSGPSRVARWRPVANWLLVIPLQIWLLALLPGAVVLAILGWFSIVFTNRLPDSWSDYQMAVLRFDWHIRAYLLAWVDFYPSFSLAAGYVDPGDYPAVLYCARPLERRRVTVIFRALLVIPQYLALFALGLAAFGVLVGAWFAVLVTGRWPRVMRTFVTGWIRWAARVAAYSLLVTDVYPPFSLSA